MRSPTPRRVALSALLVVATSVGACAARSVDSSNTIAPRAYRPSAAAPPARASCAAVRAADPSAPDGEYTLTLGGRAVAVYCNHMATSPADYLSLARAGEGINVSTYGQGPNSGGLTTRFTKVRFHPDTLTLDPSDNAFSTSTGSKTFGTNTLRANDYADAGDCRGGGSTSGTANVDLRGTPFAVARGQFSPQGWQAAGTATYDAADQVVTLTGGGFCGSMKVAGGAIALAWVGGGPPSRAADATTPDAGSTPRLETTSQTTQATSIEAACRGFDLTLECMKALSVRSPCPPSFGEAQAAGLCGGDAECAYPEGLCRCAHVSYCGGAHPTVLQEQGHAWACRPPRAPGECPESASPGSRCASNGQKCSYGACTSSTECACVQGSFKCATRSFPPAP